MMTQIVMTCSMSDDNEQLSITGEEYLQWKWT